MAWRPRVFVTLFKVRASSLFADVLGGLVRRPQSRRVGQGEQGTPSATADSAASSSAAASAAAAAASAVSVFVLGARLLPRLVGRSGDESRAELDPAALVRQLPAAGRATAPLRLRPAALAARRAAGPGTAARRTPAEGGAHPVSFVWLTFLFGTSSGTLIDVQGGWICAASYFKLAEKEKGTGKISSNF